jgi:hypothetical protein
MLFWRRENDLDLIAARVVELGDFRRFPHYEKINQFLPLELFYSFTKEGSPFAVERWGKSRLQELLNAVRPDEYMEFSLYKFEFMRMLLDEVVKRTGVFHHWSAVMDVDGANMKQACRPFVDMLKRVAKTTELHYRELMGRVFIVNANTVFTVIWGAVKVFLPARTLAKVCPPPLSVWSGL